MCSSLEFDSWTPLAGHLVILVVRTEILRGLLGSDLIGFQTHNFARHFRQTVSRILSVEAVPKGIQLENSFVNVAIFPIGIDVLDLKEKRWGWVSPSI